MKIEFLGATKSVTGSCTLLEAGGKTLIVDCGMFQGKDASATNEFAFFDPKDIDAVVLTHAHIDHTGRIPLLAKRGFSGSIHCTGATKKLCEIMLPDSGHIQESETEWQNRKRERAGKPPVEPIYTAQDARDCLKLFVGHNYDDIIEPLPGIKLRFRDVGHMLGSASLEIWLEEGGEKRKIVFSGDIGTSDRPLIKDPSYVDEADFVIMESTYGDREHRETNNKKQLLIDAIKTTFDRGGNLVIPSFAVGRTQEMLYYLREIIQNKEVSGWPTIPVYIDSPLGIEATNIFKQMAVHYYDEEAMSLINKGVDPLLFDTLFIATTAEQSKHINDIPGPKIIISSSGMCEAGRIKHHLKHNLWRNDSTILFVGYQAVGTLGRSILDGAKKVKLFGEEININAHIKRIEGFSGHADRYGLLEWVRHMKASAKKVFLIHGETASCTSLKDLIETELGLDVFIPSAFDIFDPIGMIITKAAPEEELMVSTAGDEMLEDMLEKIAAMVHQAESAKHGLPSENAARLDALAKELALLQKKHAG